MLIGYWYIKALIILIDIKYLRLEIKGRIESY